MTITLDSVSQCFLICQPMVVHPGVSPSLALGMLGRLRNGLLRTVYCRCYINIYIYNIL